MANSVRLDSPPQPSKETQAAAALRGKGGHQGVGAAPTAEWAAARRAKGATIRSPHGRHRLHAAEFGWAHLTVLRRRRNQLGTWLRPVRPELTDLAARRERGRSAATIKCSALPHLHCRICIAERMCMARWLSPFNSPKLTRWLRHNRAHRGGRSDSGPGDPAHHHQCITSCPWRCTTILTIACSSRCPHRPCDFHQSA